MRYLKIFFTLTTAFLLSSSYAQQNAIFNGGNNEGYASGFSASSQNNNIFNGSSNDGYQNSRTATTTGNSVFLGGINDGYSSLRTASASNNNIFSGGVNDGFAKAGVPLATNNTIFTGGINDGYSKSDVATITNSGVFQGGIDDGYATQRTSDIVADPNLPIELLFFDAFRDGAEVLTQWETLSEFNNDFFTVEKMKTPDTIIEVGSLPSQGNGADNRFYELMDVSPFSGTSYYRLRQTDLDGTQIWSEWVAVHFEESNIDAIDLSVQPNPVFGADFDIVITGISPDEPLEIRIYDMRAVLIHKEGVNAVTGSRLRKTINPGIELPGGMYVVEVSGRNYRLSRKLLVVR
ncbi:MAG: hypothetical protein AAF502_14430 [Bacteroidota bacterium]